MTKRKEFRSDGGKSGDSRASCAVGDDLLQCGMGFRFRRTLRLAPGIRINLSKSGGSLSLGRRGAKLNISRRGTKATVGVPGTGLSYSTMLKSGPPTALPPDESAGGDGTIVVAVVAFVALLALLIAL